MLDDATPPPETLLSHFAEDREAHFGAAAPPLYQSSTFTYPDSAAFLARRDATSTRYDYSRVSNPTTDILERKIAALEGGDACRAFASGMAAITAAILSCVKTGDHVVCVETVYGPTRTLLTDYLPKFGIETSYVRGVDPQKYVRATRPNTRIYYTESPSSLLFELQDLAAVANLARARNIRTICDNSNATPLYQNPIRHGIDLVVHTATKYIGGHSDLVAGLVIGPKTHMASLALREGELLGGCCDPFAAWLMLRGLRTLSVRLERHQQSATRIAAWLADHPAVSRVRYDGLSTHPQADLARRQMRGHSGMLSFELKDNRRETTCAVIDRLKWFCIAVSWGGYESLAIPLHVTDPASHEKKWIIRLSIGLESVDDLLADLTQALG